MQSLKKIHAWAQMKVPFHQIFWNQHLKPSCEIWAHSEKIFFFMQKGKQCGHFIIMKFSHLLKVHLISSNFHNLLESASETWMWNLCPFRDIKNFHAKMLTAPSIQNIVKFLHLLKVHQISSNLQNLLKSASETCMWNLSPFKEVKIFHAEMPTAPV